MAENNQHLKHGKALCGKVFGRFVETFNALVDFMHGLRGDAEGKNGEGHITYDRKNHIIRCDGCGGGGGGGSDVTAAEGSGLVVEDGEIDLSGREDTFGIHTLTVKGVDDEDDKSVKFLGTADIEIPAGGGGGVTSLNGLTGEIEITGGEKINVSKNGKNIKISFDESKEDPDPEESGDTNTNCDDHPGSEEGGGVGAAGPGGAPAEGGGGGSSGVGCDC